MLIQLAATYEEEDRLLTERIGPKSEAPETKHVGLGWQLLIIIGGGYFGLGILWNLVSTFIRAISGDY